MTEIRSRTLSTSIDMTGFYSKVGLPHLETKQVDAVPERVGKSYYEKLVTIAIGGDVA